MGILAPIRNIALGLFLHGSAATREAGETAHLEAAQIYYQMNNDSNRLAKIIEGCESSPQARAGKRSIGKFALGSAPLAQRIFTATLIRPKNIGYLAIAAMMGAGILGGLWGRLKSFFSNTEGQIAQLQNELSNDKAQYVRPGELARTRIEIAALLIDSGQSADPRVAEYLYYALDYFKNGGSGRGRVYKDYINKINLLMRRAKLNPYDQRALHSARRAILIESIAYYENKPRQDDGTARKLVMLRAELEKMPETPTLFLVESDKL